MHARIGQLLSLRDGDPVAAPTATHVESCSVCAAQLVQLQQTRQRLQSLASFDPPAAAWDRIVERVQSRPAQHRRRFAMTAAAVVSVLAVFIGITTRDQAPSRVDTREVATQRNPPAVAPLDQLVEQSRELDAMLQHLPERPSVERVAMAGTIDTLEQRIQWLDMQLSYAPDTGLNDAQAYRLWRERVDLMDSLVKVRYAESSRLSF
jgi:multidrug efflux pump subunit AcrB